MKDDITDLIFEISEKEVLLKQADEKLAALKKALQKIPFDILNDYLTAYEYDIYAKINTADEADYVHMVGEDEPISILKRYKPKHFVDFDGNDVYAEWRATKHNYEKFRHQTYWNGVPPYEDRPGDNDRYIIYGTGTNINQELLRILTLDNPNKLQHKETLRSAIKLDKHVEIERSHFDCYYGNTFRFSGNFIAAMIWVCEGGNGDELYPI